MVWDLTPTLHGQRRLLSPSLQVAQPKGSAGFVTSSLKTFLLQSAKKLGCSSIITILTGREMPFKPGPGASEKVSCSGSARAFGTMQRLDQSCDVEGTDS